MCQGSADEVVVAVKIAPAEGMETCLRIKAQSSDRSRGEGWNKLADRKLMKNLLPRVW